MLLKTEKLFSWLSTILGALFPTPSFLVIAPSMYFFLPVLRSLGSLTKQLLHVFPPRYPPTIVMTQMTRVFILMTQDANMKIFFLRARCFSHFEHCMGRINGPKSQVLREPDFMILPPDRMPTWRIGWFSYHPYRRYCLFIHPFAASLSTGKKKHTQQSQDEISPYLGNKKPGRVSYGFCWKVKIPGVPS